LRCPAGSPDLVIARAGTKCPTDGMGEPAGAATAIEIMTDADASLFI
jgi:hypothetical protein